MSTDNTTQPLDVAALTALEQDATPAPWSADTNTRGDCVLWGPDGQFVANAQSEPHWLPAANGGKRAVMFDVDRRDVALIAAMRNQLPALLSELAKVTAERDEARSRHAELENAINWDTTCLGCSQTLDGAYMQTMRAETAEAERDAARREAEQLRYERRLLGFARMTLDAAAEYENLHQVRQEATRREAADIAQRIVDEIGHPVTDEDALGPDYREQIKRLSREAEQAQAERDAAYAALRAIDEHVGLMESEIGDHQSYDYNVNDIDEVASNAHQQGCYAEHEKITRELLELLDNDAVRLATGVTCQPGQPWSCGDAHTAGHCVRPQAAATPAAAPKADPYPLVSQDFRDAVAKTSAERWPDKYGAAPQATAPDHARYPHARCPIVPLHIVHTWGDPLHWCDAQPLPAAAPKADDLDAHIAEQMTDPVFAAAYRARQAAAPVVPASGELCRNEYPPGKKSREHNPGWHTRIVDCDLPAGHKGDHEETGTGNTWPQAAGAGDGEQDTPCGYMFVGPIATFTCDKPRGHGTVHHDSADMFMWTDDAVGNTPTAAAAPDADSGETHRSCGCLTNSEGSHRGDCPEWETLEDRNGRYWLRRVAADGGMGS